MIFMNSSESIKNKPFNFNNKEGNVDPLISIIVFAYLVSLPIITTPSLLLISWSCITCWISLSKSSLLVRSVAIDSQSGISISPKGSVTLTPLSFTGLCDAKSRVQKIIDSTRVSKVRSDPT